MFARQKPEVGMNLPVASHIDRLAEIVDSMKSDTESMQKQLQILRGNITQLSYINKESDKQLNSFLIDGIASLRNKWGVEFDTTHQQLQEHKKKLLKLNQQHEDVQIMRQQLQQRVQNLAGAVGLIEQM